jgi:hypothetical protein
MIAQITDYSVYDVPPYLLQQFVETDVESAMSIFNPQFEAFENAAYGFFAGLHPTNAIGAQLDLIGVDLEIDRNGLGDDSYRNLLFLKGEIDTSGGTPETIIETIKIVYKATIVHYSVTSACNVKIQQNGSLGLLIYLDAVFNDGDYIGLGAENSGVTLQFTGPDLAAQAIIEDVIPAGVNVTITQI